MNIIEDLSVYVNSSCNFDCTYCDRQVIPKQHIHSKDINQLCDFINNNPHDMLSFHGGEVLTKIKVLDTILSRTHSKKVFIQTNGSLIINNIDFFIKFRDRLFVSISYDFNSQIRNRKYIDIVQIINKLRDLNIGVQLQGVFDLRNLSCLNISNIAKIVELYRMGVSSITFIPLLYSRHNGSYEMFIENYDPAIVLQSIRQFIETLYVQCVYLTIMGYTKNFERRYWDIKPKQLVLAPDGYIYPDYGFVENKVVEARVGNWKNNHINIQKDCEKLVTLPICQSCPQSDKCGIKYIYWYAKKNPNINKCISLLRGLEIMVEYLSELKTKPILWEHFNAKEHKSKD